MKDFLKKLIARKREEMKKLQERSDASESLEEVRSIGATLEKLKEEIEDAEAQLAAIEEDEKNGGGEEGRGFDPMNTYEGRSGAPEVNDIRASKEYREAFKAYVTTGAKAEVLAQRDNNPGTASDLGILLPTTVVQEVIKGVEKVYGQFYSRVKKTNIKGGVKYPIGAFSATFARIGENTSGDSQKGGQITGYVEFSYNIGEIKIARSILEATLSVEAFEQEIAKALIEAYVEAMDKEIMVGVAANGQCEGILTEAAKQNGRIPAGNIIEVTAEEMADWTTWQKKLFAKIPISMRARKPEFAMTANTYEANLKTLKDDNNRPLATETFNPVDGAEICRFNGKEVVLVENDILKDFDEAENGEYFGMYWVPDKAYAINSNLEFAVKHYFDEDTNQYVDKALVINDGKILDPKYLYLLKKKVTA